MPARRTYRFSGGYTARQSFFMLTIVNRTTTGYLATCQTPFTPSPVLSPVFWSPTNM